MHNLTQNGLYSILKANCTYAYVTAVFLILKFVINSIYVLEKLISYFFSFGMHQFCEYF